jgi:hypothetical protein
LLLLLADDRPRDRYQDATSTSSKR